MIARIESVTPLKDGRVEVRYTAPDEDGVLPKEWGGSASVYADTAALLESVDPIAITARVTQAVQAAFIENADAVTAEKVLDKIASFAAADVVADAATAEAIQP